MHKVLVNHLGGLSLPRKSVARLTDRPDMTLDVYRGRKTTIQQKLFQGDCNLLHVLRSTVSFRIKVVREAILSISILPPLAKGSHLKRNNF